MENEIVNLATFEFDVTRLTSSVDQLRGAMFDLNKQQEANKNLAKEYQKEINELNKIQKLLENTNAESSDTYKENKGRIETLNSSLKANSKVQSELNNTISKTRSEYNETNKQLQAYMTNEGKQITLIEASNNALKTQVTNINQARASNKELLAIRNQLSPTIKEEADMIKVLNARLDQNNAFIKENGSAYEKQKIGIGDYKAGIIEAYKEIEAQKTELQELNKELAIQLKTTDKNTEEYKILNQQINNNITQINVYTNQMKEATGETGSLSDALELTTGGLGNFVTKANEAGGAAPLITSSFAAMRAGIIGAMQAGIAFLATPIGLFLGGLAIAVGIVVGAFKFMTASMNSTEEGSQKLSKITSTITGVFNGLFKVIKPLGEFLGKVFIAYIETVGEALDYMVTKVGDAAEFLGFDGVAESIREVQGEVKASAQAAMELADAEGELNKAQRDARKTQLEYQKQAEKLRQQRDDETKTVSERIRINEQLGVVLEKQLDKELEIANVALKVANARLKSEGRTTEALDKQAEALTNIADIQERLAGQESEQLANLNSLRKEAADAEKERRQKMLDDAIQKTKDEIDFFIASQGDRTKALNESIAFEQELSNKRLAAAKKEYQAGKISKLAYETEKLNITNEFAKRQIEITNEYANAEIELWKQVNKSRIEDSDFLTTEILLTETRRLEEQERLLIQQLEREKQTDALTIAAKLFRNEQLTQADLEYQAKRLAIEDETNAAIDANKVKFDEQTKARELAQLEADRQLSLLNAQTEYDEQLLNEQTRFDDEITRLNDQLAKKLITEQTYNDLRDAMEFQNAENEKKINEAKEQAIRQQYATTFGNVAKLFGERTALGKAAALAEATINTYNGVTQVWSSPSLLPEPIATISKVASTGVVLASGLAAVKKIASTDAKPAQRPSYARGTIGVSGAGTGDSDSILANLSLGESVINAASTAMFPNLLSAINEAGGGVGLNGSSSILSQSSITQNADNSQMSNMIANAVYEGSLAGTRIGANSGIKDLSNDRNIQRDALV